MIPDPHGGVSGAGDAARPASPAESLAAFPSRLSANDAAGPEVVPIPSAAGPAATSPQVYVIEGCPWPERNGLRCVIVEAEGRDHYPWHKLPKTEAVVLIANDPLNIRSADRVWSCVLSRKSLVPA